MLEDDEHIRARLREIVDEPGPAPDERRLNDALRRGRRKLLGMRIAAVAGVVVVIAGIGVGMRMLPVLDAAPERGTPAGGVSSDDASATPTTTPTTRPPTTSSATPGREGVSTTRSHADCAPHANPKMPSLVASENIAPSAPEEYPAGLAPVVRKVLPDVTVASEVHSQSKVKIHTSEGAGSLRVGITHIEPPTFRADSTPPSSVAGRTTTSVTTSDVSAIGKYRIGSTYKVELRMSNGLLYRVTVARDLNPPPSSEPAYPDCREPLLSHRQLEELARELAVDH